MSAASASTATNKVVLPAGALAGNFECLLEPPI
jgi:hypothetical protein